MHDLLSPVGPADHQALRLGKVSKPEMLFARETAKVAAAGDVEELDDDATDYYFLKLSGHKDVVGELSEVLRTVIAAEP